MVISLQLEPTCVEASDGLRDDPLEVVDDWVGHGVGGDVLPVVGGPEGHHVLPQGSVPREPAQPEGGVKVTICHSGRWQINFEDSVSIYHFIMKGRFMHL